MLKNTEPMVPYFLIKNMDGSVKKQFKTGYQQYTIRFLDRAIRFLAYSLAALIGLYVFSDSQNFLDESLFLILSVLIGLCILLALFTFTAVLFKMFYIIRYKEKNYFFLFIADIILLIFSVFAAIFFSFLIVAAQGNS